MECILRAYAERTDYLWNKWNQIDLWTTILGWLGVALSSSVYLNLLRVLRVIRLIRVGRLVISVPEFYILLSGLTTSIKPILFGSFMLVSVILVWSVIAVEVLHPIASELTFENCPNCNLGFNGVYAACLTIFAQVVAGDSWGLISIPLAKAEPWTVPILFFIMMTVSIGVMNLILAVIVEKAAEARENDHERKAKRAEEQRQKDLVELALLCDRMDHDGSGALSLEELLDGFDQDLGFQSLMQRMELGRSDMKTVFQALDDDASGEVDYLEFCYHLGIDLTRDPLMLQALTRYCVMEGNTEVKMLKAHIQDEVAKALEEQKQMLKDQLELLALIPSCEQAAKELKKKRAQQAAAKAQSAPKAAARACDSQTRKRSSATLLSQSQHLRKLQATVQQQREQRGKEPPKEAKRGDEAPQQQGQQEQQQLEATMDSVNFLRSETFQMMSESLSNKKFSAMSQLESLMSQLDERNAAQQSRDDFSSFKGERIEASHPESRESIADFDSHFEELLSKFREHMEREDALRTKCKNLLESISPVQGTPEDVEVLRMQV
eukprot:Skav205563  [mRNA]  locus=scaffold1407:50319:51971:- [translate_table: standard]